MLKRLGLYIAGCTAALAAFTSCEAEGDYPGMEYAPQMYHSVPYEPLTQITDVSQGKWLSSRADERGEFFNTNPYNPYRMNMRHPAENTVPRNVQGYLPFRMPKDTAGGEYYLREAAATLVNPIPETESIIGHGKVLYTNFCYPCHGTTGAGDGPVGLVYKGVANLTIERLANEPDGYYFYVITHGYGRMWPHDKQIQVEDRWKIVRYIRTLQQQ